MFMRLILRSSGCCLDLRPRFPRKLKPSTRFAAIFLGRDQRRSLTALNPRVDSATGSLGGFLMLDSLDIQPQPKEWKKRISLLEGSRKSRIRGVLLGLLVGAAIPGVFLEVAEAQAPARGPAPAPAKGAAMATSAPVEANLAQLMRGILYPSSNVIFAAQDQNPDKVPPAKDPATATDPLASAYGKWTAVENSGLAIAEAATLLTIQGRKCANGRAVPLQNADWAKFVQGLRDAGMAAYKAAQSKNQDSILEAAGTITEACAHCHDKYREKPNLVDRCK